MVCGEPLQNTQKICRACTAHSPPFTAMRNLANYEGVIRACIHSLKYENNQGLGEFFAGDLAEMVHQEKWKIDLVLPVPLSAQREAERGYNQAACLAKPLAARLGLHYHPFGIERTRDTPSQVGLSGQERRQNVVGAFRAFSEVVSGRRILIVDDVMTTGSTMAACSQALRTAGSADIYCLTLGRFALRPGTPI